MVRHWTMFLLLGFVGICVVAAITALALLSDNAEEITFEQHLRRWAGRHGYTGSLQPLMVSLAVSFAFSVVIARTLGAPVGVAFLVSTPVSVAIAWVLATRVSARKSRRFSSQFRSALAQFGAQLEAGAGPITAVESVARTTSEPLRSELFGITNRARSGDPLYKAFEATSERFPSKAMDLVIAAFHIDQLHGGSLQPALQEAGRILEQNAELEQEAMAEVAQVRNQFWVVLGIVSLISLFLLKGGAVGESSVLTTPAGVAGVSLGVANVFVGVIRVLRLLGQVGEG